MSSELKINLTLSNTNLLDVEIIGHLLCFSSGTGKSERSTEIKRLLRKAILEEKSVQAFVHAGYASRTIRPTLFSDEVLQERQALHLEKPKQALREKPDVPAEIASLGPLVDQDPLLSEKPVLANPVVTAGEGDNTQFLEKGAETEIDRANEVVASTQAFAIPPPAKTVNQAIEMLGHLMDSLAAED